MDKFETQKAARKNINNEINNFAADDARWRVNKKKRRFILLKYIYWIINVGLYLAKGYV